MANPKPPAQKGTQNKGPVTEEPKKKQQTPAPEPGASTPSAKKADEPKASGNAGVKNYGDEPEAKDPEARKAAYKAEQETRRVAVMAVFSEFAVGSLYQGGLAEFKKLSPKDKKEATAAVLKGHKLVGKEAEANLEGPSKSLNVAMRVSLDTVERAEGFCERHGLRGAAMVAAMRTNYEVNNAMFYQGNHPYEKLDTAKTAAYYIGHAAEGEKKATGLTSDLNYYKNLANKKDATSAEKANALSNESAVREIIKALTVCAEKNDALTLNRITTLLDARNVVRFAGIEGIRETTPSELFNIFNATVDAESKNHSAYQAPNADLFMKALNDWYGQDSSDKKLGVPAVALPKDGKKGYALIQNAKEILAEAPLDEAAVAELKEKISGVKEALPALGDFGTPMDATFAEALKKGVQINEGDKFAFSIGHPTVQREVLRHMHALANGDEKSFAYFQNNPKVALLAEEVAGAYAK
jgi:hypothetical protein